ncbi:MAG: RAMP superfamily CRISPR-associated protein [Thermoprotei archaeon]
MAYKWISINGPVVRKIDNVKPTPRYLSRVFTIKVRFKTLEPTAVCSGEVIAEEESRGRVHYIYKHFVDGGGTPVIPASSVKGCVAFYHRLLVNNANRTADLFGAESLASRVSFSNLKPMEKIDLIRLKVGRQWPPKKKMINAVKVYVATNMYNSGKEDIYIEAIPSNKILETNFVVINADKRDLVELLASIGFGGQNNRSIRIGRGKNLGMGKIIVHGRLEIYQGVENQEVDVNQYLSEIEKLFTSEYGRVKDAYS